jgi:hypothetical protein
MRFTRWLKKPPRHARKSDRIWIGDESLEFNSLFSGLAIIGSTGAGKTSFLELILREIAAHPSKPSILFCCAKFDAWESAEKIARKSGRKRDFIRFTPESGHTVDLFGYLQTNLKQSPQGVARFLDRMAGLAVQNQGQADDKTWAMQSELLIANIFDLFRCAGETPTPQMLFDILISVPKDPASAASERFLIDSACGQLLSRANLRHQGGKLTPQELKVFERAVGYVLSYLPGTGEKFLGSVLGTAITGLGQFLQEPYSTIFGSGKTTLPPEILIERGRGKILALDFPAAQGAAGYIAQAAYVNLVQMMLLASPRGNRRPVVVVRDEAQYLVTPDFDSKIQTIARSHGIITITSVQGYPMMTQAFGGGDSARVQTETFLGSHASHMVFNLATDSATREHYVKLFGTSPQPLYSGHQHQNTNPDFMDRLFGMEFTPTVGWSETHLPNVPERVFTSLRRGGREHKFLIDAIFFQSGRRFANGHPFTKISFRQDVTP